MNGDPGWPLLDRFPALASIPRLSLRSGPTPVESLESVAANLWIKRDDLCALPVGGNKVRSLEFLLGGLDAGGRIATVGSRGSTQALTTVIHGRAHGLRVSVGLWPQEMNSIAELVYEELRRVASSRAEVLSPVFAMPWLWWRGLRGDRMIPPGGTSPLGMLGHVNAALEVVQQVEAGLLPEPKQVVLPLGTGGTAAGLALGFAIAGLYPRVVAARVVPSLVGRRSRVLRLANATRALIEQKTGERLSASRTLNVSVVDDVYGGAYGRTLDRATELATRLGNATGVKLDATYSAKAFTAAIETRRDGPTLFWLTFDGRWIGERHGSH